MGMGVSSSSHRRGKRTRRAAMAEINVTPLVDVMLVLLIIFMVAAPLLTSGVPIDLPQTAAKAMNIESKPISRIQSALASANEAQAKGKLYEEFGQQRLAQSPWELSLHARIDDGLRNGDCMMPTSHCPVGQIYDLFPCLPCVES